jgi:hypothetical protein
MNLSKINRSFKNEELEKLSELSEEKILKGIINIVSCGYVDKFLFVLPTTKDIITKNIRQLIEYALVYGRSNILNKLEKFEEFDKELSIEDYNPFDLKNIEPCVYDDILNGVYWGNDEHERCIINKAYINHYECFDFIKKRNKNMSKTSFLEWIDLSYYQQSYMNGLYYCDVKKMITYFYPDCCENIHLLIELLEPIDDEKIVLKIIINIFGHKYVLSKLKM